jgi:hypothetical protein
MQVLTLIIKKKWFDMILSGEKTEEYREIKPYYESRLRFNKTHIRFRNGYRKDAPSCLVKLETIIKGKGKPEWGAPDYPVFIFKLGEIMADQHDVKTLKSYSFEDVNEFVHDVDVSFDDLKNLCLDLVSLLEKTKGGNP